MYSLKELGYFLICQVKKKEKECSFENALLYRDEQKLNKK